jgi:predicted transcriptional regulator
MMTCFAMVESSYYISGRTQSRLDQTTDNSLRQNIQAMIAESPGSYFRSTIRYTNRTVGVIQYHMNWLTDHGKVVSFESNNYKGYFPASMAKLPDKKKRALIMLRVPQKGKILELLARRGNLTQHALAELLQISEQNISYHLIVLERMGLISRIQNGLGKLVVIDEEIRVFLIPYLSK